MAVFSPWQASAERVAGRRIPEPLCSRVFPSLARPLEHAWSRVHVVLRRVSVTSPVLLSLKRQAQIPYPKLSFLVP